MRQAFLPAIVWDINTDSPSIFDQKLDKKKLILSRRPHGKCFDIQYLKTHLKILCLVAVVQSLSCVSLFPTPWMVAHQASLSFTISQSLLKLMSIKLMMPFNYLILCHPLPSIFPISVFPMESALYISWPKYWSFSFSISPSSEYSGLDFL